MDDLDALFRPKSVAVLGASAHEEKMGYIVLKNLSRGKFKLFPVNPKETKILGFQCYPSISEVPGEVDLAVLALPARASEEAVRACA